MLNDLMATAGATITKELRGKRNATGSSHFSTMTKTSIRRIMARGFVLACSVALIVRKSFHISEVALVQEAARARSLTKSSQHLVAVGGGGLRAHDIPLGERQEEEDDTGEGGQGEIEEFEGMHYQRFDKEGDDVQLVTGGGGLYAILSDAAFFPPPVLPNLPPQEV
jgi:hypothetical protein